MDDQQLRHDLEKLRAELHRTESLDENQREMLRTLAADIEDLLGRKTNHPQHYKGLRERLREAVAELEASHPRTTLMMRQVIDSLAYLGI